MPVTLRGAENCLKENRPQTSQTDVNSDGIGIVHINRKSTDEYALMVLIRNKNHRALWVSGAGKSVVSFDCYQSIPTKYKTELYPRKIKIRASNGTFITKKAECDLTFVIGDERFTFSFLCSDHLSQQIILGHNLAKSFHIGTWWDKDDTMYLTGNGTPLSRQNPLVPSILLYFVQRVQSFLLTQIATSNVNCLREN